MRKIFILALMCCCLTVLGQSVSQRNAEVLASVAFSYYEEGRFSDAVNYYRCALSEYRQKGFDEECLIVRQNLSSALVADGHISEALSILDSLAEYESLGDLEVPIMNTRAELLSKIGRKVEALSLWKSILPIADDSIFPALSQNAAATAMEIAENSWARAQLWEALALSQSALDSVRTIRLLARAEVLNGRRKSGDKWLAKAREITGRLYTSDTYEFLVGIVNEAVVYELSGRMEDAMTCYRKAYLGLTDLLGDSHPETITALYGLARTTLGCGDDEEASLLYGRYAALKSNYLALEATRLGEEDLRYFWLNNSEGVFDAPLYAQSCNSSTMTNILDMVLLSKSFTFDCSTRFDNVLGLRPEQVVPSWRESAEALPDNAVALEFVDFCDIQGNPCFGVFIYMKRSVGPSFLRLPATAQFIEKATYDLDMAVNDMFDMVWNPITSYLPKGCTVYYAPSPKMSPLPMDACLDVAGEPLYNSYSFVRLITTRDIPLVVGRSRLTFDMAFLFGDMDYIVPNKRGWTLRLSKLEGSRIEMDALPEELNSVDCISFRGEAANERTFRACPFVLDGQALLYISTHGKYFTVNEAAEYDFFMEDSKVADKLESLPMTRNVLFFSGAQEVWDGKVAVGPEDNTVTAQEISEMDMRGVSLVILACCQSGLSDRDPEGNVGFVRAFKKAGAGAIIVSLQDVDDMATMLLMRNVFSGINSKMSPEEALHYAQETVRRMPEYENPEYWAPFIVVR